MKYRKVPSAPEKTELLVANPHDRITKKRCNFKNPMNLFSGNPLAIAVECKMLNFKVKIGLWGLARCYWQSEVFKCVQEQNEKTIELCQTLNLTCSFHHVEDGAKGSLPST